MGRHQENPDLGTRGEPGGSRRPPNSDRELILNPHKFGVVGKRWGWSQSHERAHGQAVVNRVSFGMRQDGGPGLALYAEPLLF